MAFQILKIMLMIPIKVSLISLLPLLYNREKGNLFNYKLVHVCGVIIMTIPKIQVSFSFYFFICTPTFLLYESTWHVGENLADYVGSWCCLCKEGNDDPLAPHFMFICLLGALLFLSKTVSHFLNLLNKC